MITWQMYLVFSFLLLCECGWKQDKENYKCMKLVQQIFFILLNRLRHALTKRRLWYTTDFLWTSHRTDQWAAKLVKPQRLTSSFGLRLHCWISVFSGWNAGQRDTYSSLPLWLLLCTFTCCVAARQSFSKQIKTNSTSGQKHGSFVYTVLFNLYLTIINIINKNVKAVKIL